MVLRTSLKFWDHCNNNSVKCFKSPIVVDSDSMDLKLNKSNIDNEEMFPMVLGTSLRFWDHCNNNSVKCFKSPIVVDSDSMDLKLGDVSNGLKKLLKIFTSSQL
jgi:hypothetical protein